MWKRVQERIFPFIIAFSALSVSASAAFYSVSGLSKLFAGAAFAVIVMAASLEIAKLVIASLLYQYRKSLPTFLKAYLSVACFVLILITSMGIYGFLSAAYQETAAKAGSIDSQIALVETKRDNVKEQLAVYSDEKSSINTAVSELRSGLSNNKIQYTNAEGVLITTTSSATRRALEKQLDQAIARQTEINNKVDILNEKLFEYETEIVEVKIGNDIAGELGPLKYLSGLTGTPMDKIINILLLTIIFVFDPLAIALVIAANFAFEKLKPKENIYGEKFINGELLVEEEDPQLEMDFDTDINELQETLNFLTNPSHSDILEKLNKLDQLVDLKPAPPLPPPSNIIRIEDKPKIIIPPSYIPKRYKVKDDDLTITY
jgi:chaperonin cofactor prefoldin